MIGLVPFAHTLCFFLFEVVKNTREARQCETPQISVCRLKTGFLITDRNYAIAVVRRLGVTSREWVSAEAFVLVQRDFQERCVGHQLCTKGYVVVFNYDYSKVAH